MLGRAHPYFHSHLIRSLLAGLTSDYSHGLIWCTPRTAKLVQVLTGAPDSVFRPLQLNTPRVIDGVTVTAIDANHSPGACMFVFETPPNGEVMSMFFAVHYPCRVLQSAHTPP